MAGSNIMCGHPAYILDYARDYARPCACILDYARDYARPAPRGLEQYDPADEIL